MTTKKIKYVLARNLSQEDRKKHGLEETDFAQIKITNPNPKESIEINRVKSPIEEVQKAFKKRE